MFECLNVYCQRQCYRRLLELITIPEKFSAWAIKWIHKLHEEEVRERTSIQNNFQTLHNDVQKQIDDLLDLRLKYLIDDAEYQRKKELLLVEKQEVNKKLAQTDKRADDWLDLCERTFKFATYARAWFQNGSKKQKREILQALGSNLTIKDKMLSLNQRKPFIYLLNSKEKYGILIETFEPNEKIDLAIQSGDIDEPILSLLAIVDGNYLENRQLPTLLLLLSFVMQS